MTAARRFVLVLAACCAGFGLSGCSSPTGSFELDPAYWFPDGKKKLPGERRELFPEGVPGVTQGIPPELVRGSPQNQALQQQQQPVLAPAQEGAPQPQSEPQPQAEERPKPRPKKVARPRRAPPPEQEPQAQPSQPSQQSAPAGAWPAPQTPQQQPPAASAWPAPPSPGTFQR